MSVRLKDRFEAFKRDAFTCQYCGRKTPAVVLEVDHIIPRVEGGGDELENLITACFDCNHGKGPRPLDKRAAMVQIVEQTEVIRERELQLRAYNEAKRDEKARREATYEEVRDYWFVVWNETELDRWYMPWENSLRFAVDTIGAEEVKEAMEIAARRFKYVTTNAVKYFGGILKRKVALHEGRISQCSYCGEEMVLSREEAAQGVDGWYHVSCKEDREP